MYNTRVYSKSNMMNGYWHDGFGRNSLSNIIIAFHSYAFVLVAEAYCNFFLIKSYGINGKKGENHRKMYNTWYVRGGSAMCDTGSDDFSYNPTVMYIIRIIDVVNVCVLDVIIITSKNTSWRRTMKVTSKIVSNDIKNLRFVDQSRCSYQIDLLEGWEPL